MSPRSINSHNSSRLMRRRVKGLRTRERSRNSLNPMSALHPHLIKAQRHKLTVVDVQVLNLSVVVADAGFRADVIKQLHAGVRP